jgi:Domain of unknown function (DUF1729)
MNGFWVRCGRSYLTGDWTLQGYGVQPMPFDGILFASRVVAKEVHTSSSIKDFIVVAPGMDKGTYCKPTGGIQYVCAGELVALQTLTNVNYLKVQKIDIAKVRCNLFLAGYLYADLYQLMEKEILSDIVTECFDRAKAQQMN